MTRPAVLWRTGSDHGLVWDWGLAIVSGEIELDQVTSLWTVLDSGSDLGLFLQTLGTATDRSVLSLPDFAVVVHAPDSTHVAVRGRCAVVVEVGGDRTSVEGGGVTTWVERRLEGAVAVEMSGGIVGSGEVRPLQAGVVPCSELRGVMSGAARPSFAAAERAAPETGSRPDGGAGSPEMIRVPEKLTAEPQVPEAQVPGPQMVEPPDSGPLVAPGSGSDPESPVVPLPSAPSEPSVDVRPEATAATDGRRATASETLDYIGGEAELPADEADPVSDPPASPGRNGEVGGGDSLGLWQREFTSLAGVEQAAVRVVEEPAPPATTGGDFINDVPRASGDAPTSSPSGADVGSGRSAVAGRRSAVEGATDSYNYLADLEEHDSFTVARIEDLVPTARVEHPDDADDELITAAMCAEGHPNPVHRTACRICGGTVAAGERTRVPRPSLGTVVSSTGESFELTGPIIVGRKPRVDRVQGPQIPRLMPLPHGHVSANHLQLRTEGWTVLAIDLHSRNGTFLRRQGQPTVRLPETPMPLVAGDVLDLGQGVQLTFQDLP